MSIKPVTYYMVECDEPGCGRTTSDLSCEYAAWADHGQAADDWTSCDGIVLDDGTAYCDEHSRDKVCDHCSEYGETEADADGDRICAECKAEVSA